MRRVTNPRGVTGTVTKFSCHCFGVIVLAALQPVWWWILLRSLRRRHAHQARRGVYVLRDGAIPVSCVPLWHLRHLRLLPRVSFVRGRSLLPAPEVQKLLPPLHSDTNIVTHGWSRRRLAMTLDFGSVAYGTSNTVSSNFGKR